MRNLLPALVLSTGLLGQTSTWIQRPSVTSPLPTMAHFLVFDEARGQTLLFQYGTTWIHDGVRWTQRFPAHSPPARSGDGCYDSTRGFVVAVVGNESVGLETWQWNGSDWGLLLTGGMTGRRNFRLAYDAARQQTILYGGTSNGNDGIGETWAWDGASWRQLSNGGPSPRWDMAMVYDAQRQTVLLFGGYGAQWTQAHYLDGTWEWDGAQWHEHFGIVQPSPRLGASMEYDSRRGRTVLYGGSTNNALTDTWEWDGSAWTQVQPAVSPGVAGSGMVFDSGRGVCMLWTGNSSSSSTWDYVATGNWPTSFGVFGQGCAGPAGVPTLAAASGSLPRLGATFTVQLSNLPLSPFNLPFGVLGFDAMSWNGVPLPIALDPLGMPGCQAFLAPSLTAALAGIGGVADWSLAVPLDLDLLGVEFFQQGALLAPGWNAGGLAFSNAGHGVVGL